MLAAHRNTFFFEMTDQFFKFRTSFVGWGSCWCHSFIEKEPSSAKRCAEGFTAILLSMLSDSEAGSDPTPAEDKTELSQILRTVPLREHQGGPPSFFALKDQGPPLGRLYVIRG